VLLDINLLKSSKIEFVLDPVPPLTLPDGAFPPKWLAYAYRTTHPALSRCWLSTKLAEWIGENLQEELGFPYKANKRAHPGTGWTPAELYSILHDHIVAGELTTFGCVEWQSQLFRRAMRARCYSFDVPKKRFHGFNPKVCKYTLDVCVHASIYPDVLYLYAQATIVIVPPYPYCIEEDGHDQWKTVGMHVSSSSSSAICVLSMQEGRGFGEEHDIQSRSRYIQVYTCIS
jgi:hypothetical protein